MANKMDNTPSKKLLQECAKIINDQAVQLKIITAVKAASGKSASQLEWMNISDSANSLNTGSVQTDQVRHAAEGLRRSIKDMMDTLCAASLKQQLRNTQLQTTAIKNVIDLFRSAQKA